MVEAGAGDALIVSAASKTSSTAPWLGVIDGGPPGTPLRTLLPALDYIIETIPGQADLIDLLAVTHVDADHIGGAIDILRGVRDASIPQLVATVWHNSFTALTGDSAITEHADALDRLEHLVARQGSRFLNPAGTRVVVASIGQGITLRDLIAELGFEVNPPEGGLLMQGRGARWENGPSIDIVGPTQEDIDRLRSYWEREVNRQRNTMQAAAKAAAAIDTSVTNRSSLVFVLNHEGKRALFTGDARSDGILANLRDCGYLNGGRIEVDAFKVPHHGSQASCSPDLFRAVISNHYLISGDGTSGNPSPTTARWLADSLRGRSITVWMTHEIAGVTDYLDRFSNITVLVPEIGSPGIEISL